MASGPGSSGRIPEHRLAEVAIRSGKVAPPQVAEALELAARMRQLGVERDLLGALVDKRIITSDEADDLRRRAGDAAEATAGGGPTGGESLSSEPEPGPAPAPAPAAAIGLPAGEPAISFEPEPGPPAAAAAGEEPQLRIEGRPARGDAAPCAFHPDRGAVAVCRQCGRPVCSECIVRTERGSFCSRECLTNWQLTGTAKAEARAAAAAWSEWVGKLLILAVVVVILGGFGWFAKHVYDGYRFNSAMVRSDLSRASPEEVISCLRTAVAIRPDNVKARQKLGQALLAAGEAAQAADMLADALELDAGNVEVIGLLADAHIAKRSYDEAASVLGLLNERKGGSSQTNMKLGLLYLDHMKDPAKAVEALRLAVASGSESREGRYLLGRALFALGNAAEARGELERSLAPLSGTEKATAAREEDFLTDRKKVSDVYAMLADIAEQEGDAEAAEEYLTTAQDVAPGSLPVVERLVRLLLSRGKVQEAILAGEKSMQSLSGNADFVLMLSGALDEAGLDDRRLVLLRSLYRRSSSTPGLLEALIAAEAEHGEPEAARALLAKVPAAKRVGEEFAPAWAAIIRSRIARGDVAGAEGALKDLGGLTESDTRFAVLWCRVLHLQGRGPEAIEHAKRATKKSPDAPTPYLVLGTVYRSLGLSRDAFRSVQKAVELGGGAAAEFELGLLLWEGGFPEEAAKRFAAAGSAKDLPRRLRLRIESCLARLGGDVSGGKGAGAQADVETIAPDIAPPAPDQGGLLRQIHLATYGMGRYAAIVAGTSRLYANREEELRFGKAMDSAVLQPGEDYTDLQAELRTSVESFGAAMAGLVPEAKADVDAARSRYVSAVAARPDLPGLLAAAAGAQADMAAAALRSHPGKADVAPRLASILRRLEARRAVAPEPAQRAVSSDYATAEMLAALVDCGPQGFTYRVAVDRALADAAAADASVADAFAQLSVSRAACFRLLRILCWQAASAAQAEGDA